MSDREDVLIIGGGVIGVCAAYYLRARGRSVTLIERAGIAAGSSYGNAGLIVPSHAVPLAGPGVIGQALKWLLNPESPFYIKPRLDFDLLRWLWRFWRASNMETMRAGMTTMLDLNQASMTLYEELVTLDDLDFGFENKGILHVFNSEDGLAHGQHEADLLETAGIEVQRLNADEVHEIEPNILPSVIGGVFYPGDAHLIPDRFVHQLAHLVESQGVRIKTGTEVLGFERSGSQVQRVITTRGNFQADQIVLATGAWSPDVGQDLGYRLPIQAAKGYSLTFKRPSASLTLPITLGERKVVLTPMGETLRFGGTLELAGLDLSVNRRRVATVQGAARDYLRHMDDLELVEIWRGLRPLTPDTLPIIGRSERLENLIFATGHGMLGMSLGPITGQLVAQIVTGETPSIDLTPLRAERFE